VTLLLATVSSAELALYGIKVHKILRFYDSSLNYVESSGLVVHYKEISFLDLQNNPVPNAAVINPDRTAGGLYVSMGGANLLPTLHWPDFSTITWSRYGCWTNTLAFDTSTSTLLGTWNGNGTDIVLYKANPTNGTTTPFTSVHGFSVISIVTDSNFHIYIMASRINNVGPSFLNTVDTRSGKVFTSNITENIYIQGIAWDYKRSALVGIAQMPTGNFHFVRIDPKTGKVLAAGSPISVEFPKQLVGPAINGETDTLWFMGQYLGTDTLFTIDLSNGAVLSYVTVSYVDGGTLTSLFWSESVVQP